MVHQLLRVPGAARLVAGAHAGNPGDLRLQQVARRFRRCSGKCRSRGDDRLHVSRSGRRPHNCGCRPGRPALIAHRARPALPPARPVAQMMRRPAVPASGTLPSVPRLSVTITKNEAADLGDALSSVRWADELIVVELDEQPRDRRHRAPAYRSDHRCATGPDTSSRRTTRASIASHDWILSLDADERVARRSPTR